MAPLFSFKKELLVSLGSMESIILSTSRRFIKVFLIAATAILASLFSPAAFAHGHPHPPQPPPDTCRLLVVGFTGGTEAPDWDSSGVVQIRYRLQNLHQPGLCVHTFSAYYWWLSKAWVRERFGATADEQLTPEQIAKGPKVIIYGHSFGGWATMSLARDLQAQGIPIELTVQMDSIGITDRTVPPNVKEAANYYERQTFVLQGRGRIHAHDKKKTKILGNYKLDGYVHYNISRSPQISDLIVNKAQAIYEDP
jgi:hypothetical protein